MQNVSSIHWIKPKGKLMIFNEIMKDVDEEQHQLVEHIDQILEKAQKDIFFRYSK